MPINIVVKLRDLADRAIAQGLVVTAYTLQEAADEIEYLRERCECLDKEAELGRGIRSRKDGWG